MKYQLEDPVLAPTGIAYLNTHRNKAVSGISFRQIAALQSLVKYHSRHLCDRRVST